MIFQNAYFVVHTAMAVDVKLLVEKVGLRCDFRDYIKSINQE